MTPAQRILRSLKGQRELEGQLAFGFVPQRSKPPYTLECEEMGVRLRLEVEDFDRFAVLLKSASFELAGGGVGGDPRDEFNERIDRLTAELSCLDGGLQLIEREEDTFEAILRTDPSRGASNRYFELTLTGGEAVLRHFHVDAKTHRRTQVSANMSMESFVTVVDQLVELFGGKA